MSEVPCYGRPTLFSAGRAPPELTERSDTTAQDPQPDVPPCGSEKPKPLTVNPFFVARRWTTTQSTGVPRS